MRRYRVPHPPGWFFFPVTPKCARLGVLHRYVDRVTELLQQKLKQSQLLALKKELMVQKQQEALQEQAALEPKLDLLLEKTRELQKLIEADISKRYSGRPVNLMGTSL